jgi:adenosine deaminase
MYLKYGVPVALATDDEGVSRGNMTQEYQRAAETYHLSYIDLKKMARASLAYSFLPGADLQTLGKDACSISGKQSAACAQLLKTSQKAAAEAELESAFIAFENQFANTAVTGKAKK